MAVFDPLLTLTGLYLAFVLSLTWPSGPSWPVLVMAAVLQRHRGSMGVVWAGVTGLAWDVLADERLGLRMGGLAVLACLAITVWPSPRSWGWTCAVAGGLSLATEWAAALPSAIAMRSLAPLHERALAAVSISLQTVLVAAVVVGGVLIVRRLRSADTSSTLQLDNRWTMLTE